MAVSVRLTKFKFMSSFYESFLWPLLLLLLLVLVLRLVLVVVFLFDFILS